MGVKFYGKPTLERPTLIAAWPGIGNVGLIAVDTLRLLLGAEPFAEVEPWDFFYPLSVTIRDGELERLEFPRSRFFYAKTGNKDLLFFLGEEQPAEEAKVYQMASQVIEVALSFGCRRVYTAAAAVAPIHHSAKPRVWAVPNRRELTGEVKGLQNTVLMSELEGRGGQGNISGLNGLLLGVARRRDLEGICLLGEIPIYLSQLPLPYPKASKAIAEVLAASLGVKADLGSLDTLARQVGENIEAFYAQIPPEIRQRLEQLRPSGYVQEKEPGPITDEDMKGIVGDVERFFKKRGMED